MSTFYKEDGIVSPEEADICLNCKSKRCTGTCERLQQEKRRIKAERKAGANKAQPREEFIIPDEAPWPKKKPRRTD